MDGREAQAHRHLSALVRVVVAALIAAVAAGAAYPTTATATAAARASSVHPLVGLPGDDAAGGEVGAADGSPAPGAGYAWPLLPRPEVLTPFRAPSHPYGPGHRGVDLAGAPGQPVLAARAGVVIFAGPVAGRSTVSVQHDDGLRTTYEPVTPTVTAGAIVAAGQVLGLLEPGHASCPTACLHWGARRDRLVYVDPLVLLRPPRIRLLPVPEQWPPRPG
ncbi:MAG: M23 family metallopeptidase [Pseudonocardia sp.]|nr:M23 family metallopeptidase [Pseudonocardia sp.]